MSNGQKNSLLIGCVIAMVVAIVLFIVLVVLVVLFLPMLLYYTQGHSGDMQCLGNQRQIVIGLYNYEMAHRRLPPACV
ncbi:MAG: hypothetical protein PVH19_08650, partial [Planctomycetia bacterium]